MTVETRACDIGMIHAKHRCPVVAAMAVFTQIIRLNMLCILAGGGGAIVTAGAVTADTGMIKDSR
jgi:hypothetical protein